jgi:hypothetical protein
MFTGRPRLHLGISPSEVYIVRRSGGLELIDPDDASWDRLSHLVTNQADDVLAVSYVSTVARHGWWYPMFESGEQMIQMVPLRGSQGIRPFTTVELERARRLYLAWLASAGVPELADMLLDRDRPVHRLVPLNLLMNGVTVLTLAAIGFSAVGMRRYVRVLLAGRRLGNGRCGVCRYDLTMIEPAPEGKRCPECGALWDPTWLKGLSAARP